MNYENFCKLLKRLFKIRPLKDNSIKIRGNVLFLRHDVDSDFETAVKMAKIENEYNIKSTYFMLHTAPYFKIPSFMIKCRYMQNNLGHEIGIHNNVMAVRIQNKGNPKKTFDRVLEKFRRSGINIYGTSAHGSKACKYKNIDNRYLFSEYCKKDSINGIKLRTISLKTYNLYGAYNIKHDVYVTDSGGYWHSNGKKIDNIIAFLENLNTSNERIKIQLLTHPCRWEI